MIFKSDREALEYSQAELHGRAIVPVLLYADAVSRLVAGKDAIVTSILRTAAEQDAICRQMGVAPYRSVHELWRGADLRWWIYTSEEVTRIVALLNAMFVYGGRYQVAKFHQRGTAPHLHLQVPGGGAWKGV